MKIAIDIDGVILDTENLFKEYAETYNKELGKKTLKNQEANIIEEKYDWSIQEISNFWKKYTTNGTIESRLMPKADIIIKKLKKEGHTLIINTARGKKDEFTTEELKKELIGSAKEKLKKENLEFNKYYWAVENKAIPCKKENVDIMIEDNYKNCLDIAKEKIHVLYLVNGIYKKTIENQYIHEVNNWEEIYNFIKYFKN